LNAFSFNVIGSLNRLYFLRQAHLLKCLRILAIASKIVNKCCSFLGATKKILPFKVKKITDRVLMSRHCYDLYQLSKQDFSNSNLRDVEFINAIIEHRK